MPDAYGIRQPSNVTPPLPGGTASSMGLFPLLGGRGFSGLGGGSGMMNQRLLRAGRKPGLDPIVDPELAGLTQAGPNGEIYDPESLYGTRSVRGSNPGTYGYVSEPTYDVRGRKTGDRKTLYQDFMGYSSGHTSPERMRAMAQAVRNYGGGLVGQRMGRGFGVGGSDTPSLLRKMVLEGNGPGGGY